MDKWMDLCRDIYTMIKGSPGEVLKVHSLKGMTKKKNLVKDSEK